MSSTTSGETSYSYSVSPAAPARTDGGEHPPLVAFATCELIPIDGQLTLMINRENGKQQLIAAQVLEALKTCVEFESVQVHTQRICADSALKGQEKVVEQTLEKLRGTGFLLEASTVCARLNEIVEKPLSKTRVFVITSDRPACLENLLASMLQAGGLSQHQALFLIDDSKREGNQTTNKELVDKFNTRCTSEMRYIGLAEQSLLMDQLIADLPKHEQGIRFLIDHQQWVGKPSYGRSRTLCLLLSVGYRALVLDDDILCRAMRPAVPEDGVSIGGEGRQEASFFADRDSLMASGQSMEESPLDLHARFLGSSVSALATGLNGGPLEPAQLRGTNAAMANIWRADSPVLVSQCGSWGDPGTRDAHWTLTLSDHSISRLLTAHGGIINAIEARCAWLGTPRPTIMKMAFMSQMTGVDNSALLPPYFPAYRGEDMLFAAMVEAMHPHGAVVEQGFAVPHLPEARSRKQVRDPIAGAGGTELFASYLINQIDYTDGNDPLQRLALIAADLRRLADKSTEDLLLDYRREVAQRHALQLRALRRKLEATRDFESANWTGYLERGIIELEQALQREWSPTDIDEVAPGLNAADTVHGFRSFLRGFAAALDAWNEMRAVVVDPLSTRHFEAGA